MTQLRLIFTHRFENNSESEKHLTENRHRFNNQCDTVLTWFKQGGTLTCDRANELFSIKHLPRRICDLREAGIAIQDRWIKAGGTKVKEYFLQTNGGTDVTEHITLMGTVTKNPNFAQLSDQVEADAVVQTIAADANGNLQNTYQKILIDDTDGTEENDGSPVTFQLSASAVAAIMAIEAQEIEANETGGTPPTYAVTVTPAS